MRRKLEVIQQKKNGVFGNDRPKRHFLYGNHEVTLEDALYRTVIIETDQETDIHGMISIFLQINRFCMVCDGCFHDISKVHYMGSPADTDKLGMLSYYKLNSDFYGSNLLIVRSIDAISTELLLSFDDIENELVYPNSAFMYMTNIGGLPLDMRTAYFTECFEPLALYVSTQVKNELIPQENPKRPNPTLYDCIDYIISLYGQICFSNEISSNMLSHRIRQMVNNRVQLMHLKKDMDNKPIPNDKERITYSRKLHLLYRLTILHLAGYDTSTLTEKLTENAKYWEQYLNKQEDSQNG